MRCSESQGIWEMSAINAHSAIIVLTCLSLCGCFSLGNTRLYEDRLGYSRALGDAEKSDTLLDVVRLRYADTLGASAFPSRSPVRG